MNEPSNDLTENQIKILKKFVTNVSGNIFALRNLPEVIKGALFSRYSRSYLGLKELLLKEFILNDEVAFSEIVGSSSDKNPEAQSLAIHKAQNFYDRILDGYGDDSIGELGGAHLALENISMIAAKEVEDKRIGGSPLEKSTRYIYFDKKTDGQYAFYREPIIMTSAYKNLYVDTCNLLFDTYSQLIPKLTEVIEKTFPQEGHISQAAYKAALRAKVLDCLRGLLPASTLTNMGVYGNGRFFEALLQSLQINNLTELQETGKSAFTELSKIIPSFVRRADTKHKYFQTFAQFQEQMHNDLKLLSEAHEEQLTIEKEPGVFLVHHDPDCIAKIAGALLFDHSSSNLYDLQQYCLNLPEEELSRILDAACLSRENRRHKSPRALEHAFFTFEIIADFGIYRDLQRHRMLTQSRQLLTCNYGYYIPSEIKDTDMEKPYIEAMEKAKEAYDQIAAELPEEAQYIVPMAYNLHWYFHVNLRALQWLCELRSSPAGHPMYRRVAQEMARQVCEVYPALERFFKFVDYDGYDLGRMDQEIKKEAKLKRLSAEELT